MEIVLNPNEVFLNALMGESKMVNLEKTVNITADQIELKDALEMIDDLKEFEGQLSHSECLFLDELEKQIEDKGFAFNKQIRRLERISESCL